VKEFANKTKNKMFQVKSLIDNISHNYGQGYFIRIAD